MEISSTSRYCASSSSANPYQTSIPLRRMKSSASSNYSNPFSVTSSKNPFADPETSTIASTNASLLSHNYENGGRFVPEKRLEVKTTGKNPISFPLPPKELVITILEDGKERYFSIRPKRKSGSCRLVKILGAGEEKVVGDTTYKFGTRPPNLRVFMPAKPTFPPEPANANDNIDAKNKDQLIDVSLATTESFPQAAEEGEEESPEVVDQFDVKSHSLFSRTMEFTSRRYGMFRWRYAGRSERLAAEIVGPEGHEISSLLILEKIIAPSPLHPTSKERRIPIARLIRGFGLRTEGTGRTWAGNGGVLELNLRPDVDIEDENGWDNGGVGESEELLDEESVVSTCLVMLKKEVDRLRAAQICAMSAGGGGC
ncbi:hypothetical protein B0J14DRAFT_609318 [Halenospora varia]|nr:hypothetical protein B0J14DRAFT_609318 [Halenospora varia]